MSTGTVTPLRHRMIEDMNARKLCADTQRGHIHSCKRFAAFLRRSPGSCRVRLGPNKAFWQAGPGPCRPRSMRRRGLFAEGAAAGEILAWPASHTRQHRSGSPSIIVWCRDCQHPGRARPTTRWRSDTALKLPCRIGPRGSCAASAEAVGSNMVVSGTHQRRRGPRKDSSRPLADIRQRKM
jgi:hypothetical protein